MRRSGFTLVELILVIAIIGVLASALTIFLPPVVKGYADNRRRAELTDTADTALRQIAQDIRRAVPNSLIRHSETCIQLVPTTGGGRYRMAADPDEADSKWLDTTAEVSEFDVLTPMRTLPAVNDWIVIDNHNAGAVYQGSNREQVNSVDTPSPSNSVYRHRIELKNAKQFPPGYDGGRFVVVSNEEQSVFYSCDGAGSLYRIRAGFDATAATCSAAGARVASDVESCVFSYEVGVTERSSLVRMQLQLMRDGERITLSHGVHVENVP